MNECKCEFSGNMQKSRSLSSLKRKPVASVASGEIERVRGVARLHFIDSETSYRISSQNTDVFISFSQRVALTQFLDRLG